MTQNRFSNTNKWIWELAGAYYNTFQDITVFDPSHGGVAGHISGADFAKNSIFGWIWDLNDPKSVFKHKQMTLWTSGSLLQHISGHYSFWPITAGRCRGHFQGWFRQKQHFWVNLNDPKSFFKYKQITLWTSGSLLQYISGHCSFWPFIAGHHPLLFQG